MKQASCPSCGAPVEFHSAHSVMAVCGYCQSTLVRHDVNLEDIGKMAALVEDASPIRRGMAGRYKGRAFSVIGRIQQQYEAGYWNEWYLLFDDQREGWLSEGSGQFYLTFAADNPEIIPPFSQIKVGMNLKLGGQFLTVTNLENARCVAGEGELPFKVGAGFEAPAVDLRNDKTFASIDYSDQTPRLYLGEAVELPSLKLDQAGAAAVEPAKVVDLKAFACPSCGAPMGTHSKDILCVACGSCGAIVDTSNENLAIISKVRAAEKVTPQLALGSKGRLRGDEYAIIGFLRRKTSIEGLTYEWDEYLLYSDKQGFRWLTQSEGHWNFAKALSGMPRVESGSHPSVNYLGKEYKHFQSCNAAVSYVIGEFYWKVKQGDTAECADFVAPPLMLSKESTTNEIAWSISEYLPKAEVEAVFKTPLPEPTGIGPNQPAPSTGSGGFWKMFALLSLIALILQFGFVAAAKNQRVIQHALTLAPNEATQSWTSEPFSIDGRRSNVAIRNNANLKNDWVYLDLALINTATGTVHKVGREVSYYSGYDSDGSWSEGSPNDEAFLSDIPPGQYVLEIDAEANNSRNDTLFAQVAVYRDVPVWANFWALELFLLLFPLWALWRGASFEIKRWAESDHPKITTSEDD